MESFLNDLKHSLRMLRQNPSFAITAVAVLALGIAANTAIFTVVNTVILHPLPYPEPDRIVNIAHAGGGSLNEVLFNYLEQTDHGLADLAAYQAGVTMSLTGMDRPERVDTAAASRNYFHLFGAHAILGRTFTPTEDQSGGPAVVVISYGLWQRRFAGDPAILGKTITLGGKPHQVVGVLSPSFYPYPRTDVWTPLQVDPSRKNLAGVLAVSARLSRGVSLAQARSRVAAIGKRFAQRDSRLDVTPLQQRLTGDIRPALLILLGAVGLVLLIACANVGNLLLARAAGRQKEIAIRAALGATRERIVRQLLTESLLLALAGGTAGLVLGSWAVRALLAYMPVDLPRVQEMAAIPALDPGVAVFTFLLAVVTGVVFGLVPVFHLSRNELTVALNESGSRTGSRRKQNRTRSILVAAEMAIAVVLLCGALLLIRSFAAMHSVNLGFNLRNLPDRPNRLHRSHSWPSLRSRNHRNRRSGW